MEIFWTLLHSCLLNKTEKRLAQNLNSHYFRAAKKINVYRTYTFSRTNTQVTKLSFCNIQLCVIASNFDCIKLQIYKSNINILISYLFIYSN